VQIAPEACRANDERNKEYSAHLVGPKLNMYITKMYGTTDIKYSVPSSQTSKYLLAYEDGTDRVFRNVGI
jgi:hypothetical protein